MINVISETDRFISFAALRACHYALLQSEPTISEIVNFVYRARETGSILDSSDERDGAQAILNYWSAELVSRQVSAELGLLREFDPDLAPVLEDNKCPYVGLDAFRESDQDLFFGREALITEMMERLESSSFLAVVGPSGSGKSSVVRAGLIPALARTRRWNILKMVPGSDPLGNLARLLSTYSNHVSNGQETPGPLVFPDEPTLLVLDQFEELFTLNSDDSLERQRFIEYVTNLVIDDRKNHKVVVTVREDYDEQLPKLGQLYHYFKRSQIRINPLDTEELLDAIEKPAMLVGLKFEEGIVPALVKEILGEPAALPLLQFTLLKLWDYRQRNRVTWEAYHRLGGAKKALRASADEFYEHLPVEEQETTRRILLKLVRPTLTLEVTSKRMTLDFLLDLEDPNRVKRVLTKLVKARLLRETKDELGGDVQMEVAHEALIRNWPLLLGWLDKERVAMRQRLYLFETAEFWKAHGKDPGAYLAGAPLDEAEKYDDLSPLEKEFVQASRAAINRRRYLRNILFAAVIAGIVCTFVMSTLAVKQKYSISDKERQIADFERKQAEAQAAAEKAKAEDAKRQAQSAERQEKVETQLRQQAVQSANQAFSRELASSATGNVTSDPELSILLAIQALQKSRTSEASNALHVAVQASKIRWTLKGHARSVINVAFSSDGKRMVSGSEDNTAKVWDTSRGTSLLTLTGHRGAVNDVAFDPTNQFIGTASSDKTAKIWNATSGAVIHTLQQSDQVFAIGFSPDGKRVATGSNDGSVVLWDIASGEKLAVLSRGDPTSEDASVMRVAFSPDGTKLAASCLDKTAKIWNTTSEALIMTVQYNAPVFGVAFSPNGHLLATSGLDKSAKIWDVDTGKLIRSIEGPGASIYGVAFSHDNRLLATADGGGTARIWDVATGQELMSFSHDTEVYGVAFSSDDKLLATAGGDNAAKIWNFTPNGELLLCESYVEEDKRGEATITHDASRIATWSSVEPIHIRDIASGRELPPMKHSPRVLQVIFSLDGKLVVTADYMGSAKVWNVSTGEFISSSDPDKSVTAVAVSPDSKWFAMADDDNEVLIMDVNSGKVVAQSRVGPASAPRKKARLPYRGGDEIDSLVYSSNGKYLAAARISDVTIWNVDLDKLSSSRTIKIPKVQGQQLEDFSPGGIRGLALSANGELVAVALPDSRLAVWDLASGSQLPVLSGHTSPVLALAFHPDGRRIATVSSDKTLRLWDVRSGSELLNLSVSKHAVSDLVFSADGKRIYTASADGSVAGYVIDMGDFMQLARSRLTRFSLTDAECKKYLHIPKCPRATSAVNRGH